MISHPNQRQGFRACRRTGPITCACLPGSHVRNCRGWVAVYDAQEASKGPGGEPMHADRERRRAWLVRCEVHSSTAKCETRAAAETLMMAGSREFCEKCHELAKQGRA